jgi:poly(A) polymerase
LLSDLKLLALILPEVEALKKTDQAPTYLSTAAGGDSVFDTTLKTLRELSSRNPARSSALSWAALLYDVGKPVAIERNRGKNFNGHEIDGARISQAIGERLRMPTIEIEQISTSVGELHKFREVFRMREATLERFVREPHFEEILALHRAQAVSSDGNLAFYEFCVHRYEQAVSADADPDSKLAKLIDGKDLIQLGFKPGPEFSEILRVVEDLALERKLATKEQALEYVVSRFVR